MNKVDKIGILSSVGIGDVITMGPLLKRLKEIYPQSKIVVYSFRGGCLENNKISYIDEIRRINSLSKFFEYLNEKHTLFINLGYYKNLSGYFGILAYNLINFFSKADKKISYGNLDSFEFRNKNMVEIKLDILKRLGIKLKKSDYNSFLPFYFKKARKKIKEILKENGISKKNLLAVFHIGVKRNYFTRFWPAERWAEVIKSLAEEHGAKICFIGGEEDAEKTNEIIKRLDFPALNFTNKLSLKETAALIEQSGLFISTNSGPMWIAAALHKPQIALCGPSKFSWGPYNENAISIRKKIDRKYCNPPCDAKTCRYNDYLCMNKITAKDVKNAIEKIIENAKK